MASKPFDKHTTAQEVVDTFHEAIEGKFIIVTGVAPGGVGYETARALLTKGPRLLVITGRNQAKLDASKADLLKDVPSAPSASLQTLIIDLASLSSIHSGAQELLSLGTPDILINNAAVMVCPYATTVDGFELQFGTNFVGPYALTTWLLPKMLKGAHPRIVNVSSMGHMFGEVRWDDPGFKQGEVYDKIAAYGQGKTALNLFTVHLAETYGNQGLVAMSIHPGGVATDLHRHVTQEVKEYYKKTFDAYNDDWTPKMESGAWKTLGEGASTTLVAALDPAMAQINGSYLVDCQPAPLLKEGMSLFESGSCVAPFSIDKESAKRIVGWTNELIGESFETK